MIRDGTCCIPATYFAGATHKPGDVIGKAIHRPYNRGYGCAPGMCVQWAAAASLFVWLTEGIVAGNGIG